VLVRRVTAWIARYSYGIYLSHMVSLWLVFRLLPDHSLVVQMAVLATMLVVVPMALYHTIEAPGIRLGAACAVWMRRPSRALPTRAA
jgi:peptidoglycan/LPS O-acetylase OafA/YrhL